MPIPQQRAQSPEAKLKKAAQDRRYRAAHKEEAAAYGRRWRAANADRKAAMDRSWRENNRERKAALDKAYAARRPEVHLAAQRRYTDRHRERVNLKSRLYGKTTARKITLQKYYSRNKHKHAARTAAFKAVKCGQIIKPSTCQECGQSKKLQMHHEDYAQALVVIWLCTACHGLKSRKL